MGRIKEQIFKSGGKIMIKELLEDIKELRNEMVQANWPAQRLSNIILKYEMKLQDQKSESQKLQDDLEPIDDW